MVEAVGSSPVTQTISNPRIYAVCKELWTALFLFKIATTTLTTTNVQKNKLHLLYPPVVGVGNSQTPLQWTEITSLDFFKGVVFHDPLVQPSEFRTAFFLISPALFSFRMSRLLTSKFVMRWHFTTLCFRLGSAVCPKNGRSNYFPVDNIHSYLI